ncbi:conserved hypothetical protein [uncultured Defluviicoccus sp.]|uniref:Metallo-beta-lactamase domain-containing protein n=1 Tax=metagenome TaxID=256318 RepID=A0A380TFU1_9ZZZZ|nr:conserved hypothetical protein [uncultured Defluviicoccus sp.]
MSQADDPSHDGAMKPGHHSRSEFLVRLALGGLGAMAAVAAKADDHTTTASRITLKGRPDSRIKRWDIVTVGNLARNVYWGEVPPRQYRPTLCTCTLIQGEGFRLLTDPSLASAEQMATELDRRSGLKIAAIDSVFVTHHHGDHWAGLAHFPDAKWFAAPGVAQEINATKKLPKPVEPAGGSAFAAIELVPTPGHTLSHHSLRFDCAGFSVVIAGDAVMTRDHFHDRLGHHNSVDLTLAAKSIDRIAGLADIVVPGHDNYFLNLPVP